MKQASKKTFPKWLIPVIAIVLLAAIALAIFLFPRESVADPSGTVTTSSGLYWNIDMKTYTENAEVAGFSDRPRAEDGMYHIRFASSGQLYEFLTEDARLVNYIDSMQLMGLVFDADGMIVDATPAAEIATELATDFYVKSADDNMVVINSSISMVGMDMELPVSAQTFFMDVRPDTTTPAESVPLEMLDQITVYEVTDENGTTTHAFMTKRQPQAEVYLRVGRYYSTEGTTRIPDKNGVYTLLFAKDGEQVELKCRDKELVSAIDAVPDSNHEKIMGLIFDEEGYIVDRMSSAIALRGKLLCDYYDITEIDGDFYTIEKLMAGTGDEGKKDRFQITPDTKIYTAEADCVFDFVGQRADALQVGDRIVCYTDADNNAILIYIVRRTVDSPMYYNLVQKYSSATNATTRERDENGYYVYEMVTNGKVVTLRTKDKDIASSVDYYWSQIMGLKVEGNIIKDVYGPECVCGRATIGRQSFVTDAMGTIYRLVNNDDFESGGNYLMAQDAVVCDVTGDYGTKLGQKTTIKPYDTVTATRNVRNEISHAFITSHYYEGTKIYYNINRKFSILQNETYRTTDEEGYYVFDMICEGKAVTVKTKSKELANIVDMQSAPIVAMKVNASGIIQAAYPGASAVKYGMKAANYQYISRINSDGTFHTYWLSNGEKTESTTVFKLAKNCKIYNMSSAFLDHQGETTKLQVNDNVQCIKDCQTGEIVQIFIMGRKLDSPLYLNVNRQYNSTKKETSREPDANGYYSVELFFDGQIKTFRTKDKDSMSQIDATSLAFSLILDGDIIVRVATATNAAGIYGEAGGNKDVTSINGSKVSLLRNYPGATNIGETEEVVLAKNCKVYDISPHAESYGAPAKLEVGDRVYCYTNQQKEVSYCFITSKNTREAGAVSYCEHCQKEVWWEPFTGAIFAKDVHYYLPGDLDIWQLTAGSKEGTPYYEVILDLNGYTMTSTSGRNFAVYSSLSIMDSVGTGKMLSVGGGRYAGSFMCNKGSTLNIYGGTLSCTDDSTAHILGGIIYVDAGTLNIYGGTITGGQVSQNGGCIWARDSQVTITGGTISNGTAAISGGNIHLTGKTTAQISGASIFGGDAPSGPNVEVACTAPETGACLTLKEAKIDGGLNISSKVTAALVGKNVLNGGNYGVNLTTGSTLDLSQMSLDSNITIRASGVFTTETKDIQKYLPCFKSALPGGSISAENNALNFSLILPETTEKLQFMPGTQDAICPVCQCVVAWTPITGTEVHQYLMAGGHYYLANDITASAADNGQSAYLSTGMPSADSSACFHLNDHNLTVSANRAIFVGRGILNIMGTGVVSGNKGLQWNGGTLMLNAANGTSTLNLYGGTYTKPAEDLNDTIALIGGNGGTINMYDGATIDGAGIVSNSVGGCMQLHGSTGTNVAGDAVFNMYGGTIKNGSSSTLGGNVRLATAYAYFNMYGGTITGGSAVSGGGNIYGGKGTTNIYGGTITNDSTASGANLYVDSGTLNLCGGTIDGQCLLGSSAKVTVSGAPVISGSGLNLTSGCKLTLGELTEKASIFINAKDVFTNPSSDAEKYFPYFTSVNEKNPVKIDGDVLTCASDMVDVSNPIGDAALTMTFPTDGSSCTAVCPACNKEVIWTAITGDASYVSMQANGHYYLANDITVSAADNEQSGYLLTGMASGDLSTCLHLNSCDLTVSANRAIVAGRGILNIMGSGIVSGNKGQQWNGGTIHMNASGGTSTVNLYGGTYTKPDDDLNDSIILIGGNGGRLSMYEGVVVDGAGIESNSVGTCVQLHGAANTANAVFDMYGGTIQNGKTTTLGGNVRLASECAYFNMYSGTITGGSAKTAGGNVYGGKGTTSIYGGTITTDSTAGNANLYVDTGKLNLCGGTIDGKCVLTANATVTVSGAPVVTGSGLSISSGCKLTLKNMTEKASIVISANGVFAESEKAADYAGCFKPLAEGDSIEAKDDTLVYTPKAAG